MSATPETELDHIFGIALPPKEIYPGEGLHSQSSRIVINAEKTGGLQALMEALELNCPIARLSCDSISILWVVGQEGDIIVAIEEFVRQIGKSAEFRILPRGAFELRGGKLGHAALLDGEKRGRIGGEIVHDEEEGWVINNQSGRYGRRPHLTEANLAAVADRFLLAGIKLKPFFQSF